MEDCKKLNQKAALLIIEALHSCGWDGYSHRDTALMKCLALHVHIGNLSSVPTEYEEAQSTKRKHAEEEALS